MTILAYFIFYLICALNVLYGIKKKKSNALYTAAFIVMFILMTFNYQGPDIGVYRAAYALIGKAPDLFTAINSTYMEYGYAALMFFGCKLGLNFYAFRIVLNIVCLLLFSSVIRFYKANPNFIVGLYMAYLFFIDTVQLRNFIIQFIILFATRYLLQKSFFSIFKYILCIAIAGSIHTISWLFLILLLVRFVKTNGYQLIFAAVAVMFILCVVLQPVLPQIINFIAKLIDRGSSYFQTSIKYGIWFVMALYMLGLVPLYWHKNKITDAETKKQITFFLKIKIIMGLFLPLCFINNNFNRIYRNFVVLDTIGLALLYENLKAHTEPKRVVLAAQLFLTGGWLVTDMIRYRGLNIIGLIMKCNLLFSKVELVDLTQYLVVTAICLLIALAIRKVFSSRREPYKEILKCV